MAAGLVSCPPSAALTEAATLMCVHQMHAVVVDARAPRLITARDVVHATLAGATSADEVIAPEAPSVAPDDTLLAAAGLMVHAGEGHVVVRDHGDSRARGVLSSFDVVAVLAGHEPRVARIVARRPLRRLSGGPPDMAGVVEDEQRPGRHLCRSSWRRTAASSASKPATARRTRLGAGVRPATLRSSRATVSSRRT